jgi:hypothetical protein
MGPPPITAPTPQKGIVKWRSSSTIHDGQKTDGDRNQTGSNYPPPPAMDNAARKKP